MRRPSLDPADDTARLALLRAREHTARGEHFVALAQVRVAQRAWVAAGRPDRAACAQLAAHAPLLALGEFEAVIGSVEKLFADLAALDPDLGGEERLTTWHARAHLHVGCAHDGRGDHQQALRHLDVAANLFRVLADEVGVAHTRAARGRVLLALDMTHRATDELLGAYRTFHAAHLALPAYRALTALGQALLDRGRTGTAIAVLQRVRGRLLGLGAVADAADVDVVLGAALLRAGLVEEARTLAVRAADTFARLTMTQRSGVAELLRAEVAVAAHDLPTADGALGAAERLLADCGSRHLLVRTWLAQVRVAETSGDRRRAVALAEQVLAQQADGPPTVLVGHVHLFLAAADLDAAGADRHLRAATEVAYALGAQPLHLAAGLVRARRHLAAGDAPRALEVLRRSERLAAALDHDEHGARTPPLGHSPVRAARDLLIDLLSERGTHRAVIEAWSCATAAKASSASRQAGPAAQWRPQPDDEDPTDPSGWPIDPEDLEAEVTAGPDGARFPVPGSEPPVVPEGPVLEYHVLAEDVVAFVVREGQVHLRRLRGAAHASRLVVAEWQTHCTLRGLGPGASGFAGPDRDTEARALLDDLRGLLVDPLHDLLDGEDEPWLVVAHRHLHAVPFEAILGDGSDGSGPAGEPLDLAFAFSSDAGAHRVPTAAPEPASRAPLVLSVADEAAPLIRDEAEAVAAALPGAEHHGGASATRRRLLEDCAGRTLVHVGCHGVFYSRNPFHSALRLGDGWVTAGDLLDADLGGTVLVLSACGAGTSSHGDHGPIGLAWAALAAGAAGVVAAMWPVEDAVTARLMQHFYTRLTAGVPARTALGLARRDLAAEHPDPHAWAAFRYFTSSPDPDVGTAPLVP